MAGRLVGRPADRLVDTHVGRLVGRLVGRSVDDWNAGKRLDALLSIGTQKSKACYPDLRTDFDG
jgi:hypothetical protein